MLQHLVLEFKEIPPGLNGSDGLLRMGHRRLTKVKAYWRLLVRDVLSNCQEFLNMREQDTPLFQVPVIAKFTLYSTQLRDDDNWNASFKLIGDALKWWKVIEDDKRKFLLLDPQQVKVAHKHETRCVVEISAP